LDLAMSESFTLTERLRMEFRAEGFDLLKPSQLLHQCSNLDAGNFGMGTPVVVQDLKGGLGTIT
jgi:hypothetical protein